MRFASLVNGKVIPSEESESYTLAFWLRIHKILFCHIPNEGKRSPRAGKRLKRMGLIAGAPDYLIFNPPPNSRNCGVAIELKRVKGSEATEAQSVFLGQLRANGWLSYVCYGADHAIRVLEDLGYGVK